TLRIDRPVIVTRDSRSKPTATPGGDPLVLEILPPATPPVTGWSAIGRAIVADTPDEPKGAGWAGGQLGPGRCRGRLDLQVLAGRPAPTLADLGATDRASLARAVRALGRRRVGLALGGGGAFSFVHVALIEGLLARQIPIDLVAGTSGGSLVGAYYCA